MICALVLAGGLSRRFGTEKAMALLDGAPLLAHAASRLLAQGFEVAINAPASSGAAAWATEQGLPTINDSPSDPSGPLAGVKAGLAWAKTRDAELLVTAPCDTPLLPDDLETRLAAALTDTARAATARSPSGLQSLCTVWRTQALLVLEEHFAQGRHPAVHDLLVELRGLEVLVGEDSAFANLNSPEDLVRAWRKGASFDTPASQAAQDDG